MSRGSNGRSALTRLVGALHRIAEVASDALTWCLIRAALVPEASWNQLRQWRDDGVASSEVSTEADPPEWRELDAESVKFVWNLQEAASAHTDDKFKLLLTLGSSLSTGILVITRGIESTMPWTYGIVALVFTAYLCLAALGVRTYWAPTPMKRGAEADWIRDLYSCYLGNAEAQSLRVGLLRGARRWFLAALLLVGIAGVTVKRGADPRAMMMVEEIRASAALLAGNPALRGAASAADSIELELRRLRVSVDRHVELREPERKSRARGR